MIDRLEALFHPEMLQKFVGRGHAAMRDFEAWICNSGYRRRAQTSQQRFISVLSAFSEFYQDIHGNSEYSSACRKHYNRMSRR